MTGFTVPRAPCCGQRLKAVARIARAPQGPASARPSDIRVSSSSERFVTLIAEKQRRVLRQVHLPVWPTMSAARRVPDVLHVLLREQVVHRLDAAVARVFCAATDPQDFELLIQHRRIRFLPFRANNWW